MLVAALVAPAGAIVGRTVDTGNGHANVGAIVRRYSQQPGGILSSGTPIHPRIVNKGYLQLPAGTASEFCTAHVYSGGTFVLYYDLLGTDQCGFVVAGTSVDSTNTITVR